MQIQYKYSYFRGNILMSGKSKQAVKMTKILEKASHVNLEAIEDPTLINYIRLAEVILDKNFDRHKMSYYLNSLENKEEADKRIKEIDEMRKNGIQTDAEHLVWLEKLHSRNSQYSREYSNRQVTVINPYLKETYIYKNLKEACEELDLSYNATKSYLLTHKGEEKIKYKGLIFIKD
jgi:hypothetical protein